MTSITCFSLPQYRVFRAYLQFAYMYALPVGRQVLFLRDPAFSYPCVQRQVPAWAECGLDPRFVYTNNLGVWETLHRVKEVVKPPPWLRGDDAPEGIYR